MCCDPSAKRMLTHSLGATKQCALEANAPLEAFLERPDCDNGLLKNISFAKSDALQRLDAGDAVAVLLLHRPRTRTPNAEEGMLHGSAFPRMQEKGVCMIQSSTMSSSDQRKEWCTHVAA